MCLIQFNIIDLTSRIKQTNSLKHTSHRLKGIPLERIVINGYEVNWSRAELIKGDANKSIEAKHLAILKLLTQANGNIVSQQQMLEIVWPNTVVTPNTIQQAITQLRRLLDDDGRSQKAIKTHPKLGYSLVFQETNLLTKTKETTNKFLVIFSVLIILLTLLAFSFFSSQKIEHKKLNIEKVIPITVQGEIVQSVVLNNQNKDIYYIIKNNNSHSLRKQNINSADIDTLANNLNIFGDIALSNDNKHLAFGQISLRDTDNKKCITLTIFDIESSSKSSLLPCSKNFHHSPTWLNNQTLIYTSTDKERNNTLHAVNTQTLARTYLNLNASHINSYALANKKLAVVAKGALLIFTLKTDSLAALLETTIPLTENLHNANIRWLSDNELAIFSENTVKKIVLNGDSASFTLPDLQQVNDILALDDSSFIAILGQQNWNVRERSLSTQLDTEIGASNYYESQAKYSASVDIINYLSNRSGMQQIWQQKNNRNTQLTNSSSAVDDYISVFNGSSLLFISNNKLWLQAQGLAPVALEIALTPVRLYQADNQYVLLSAQVNNEHQLLMLNLENRQWRTLLNKEVNWAQNINENMFITNNTTGQLEKYHNGKLAKITALPALTIQWRYFWRADTQDDFALYFQDKNLNIWYYDPINERAEVVDHYDINALFMTDYNAQKSSMLSDNFVTEQQQLVQLKISH